VPHDSLAERGDDENKYSTMSWPGDLVAPQNVPFAVSGNG
jgi:hypothetical protein